MAAKIVFDNKEIWPAANESLRLARVHHQLFSDPAKHEFQLNVFQLFSKK